MPFCAEPIQAIFKHRLYSSLDALVAAVNTSEISEVYAELEQERMKAMTDALREKVSKLSGFIEEYVENDFVPAF